MSLLGDDGLGYELARKLEGCGVWRSWLGESNYSNFVHFLSSCSTWESFMRSSSSTNDLAQIQLQLRARALLFDKASVSLFLRSSSSSVAAVPSNLNSTYLQLHGDDVYFSLEDFYSNSQDGVQQPHHESSSVQAKAPTKVGSAGKRYSQPDVDNTSKKAKNDELPETWYDQFIEKYRTSRQNRLQFGDRESHKRTPEGMSTYLKLLERHKRSRKAFKEDQYMGFGNPVRENGLNMHQNSISDGNSSIDDDTSFFPELMFPSNCVPDSALPLKIGMEEHQKVECYGVLDSLPHVMTRSPAMLERFGIRPDYLRMGLGRSKYRGKNGLEGNGKSIGQDQASQMARKVIVRVLANAGFEGATEVPMEVLSQFLSCHIIKLGRILKVLTDNYKKQCSALDILKMFLQAVGYSNLGALAEHVKGDSRTFPLPTQQLQQQQLQQQQQPQQQQQQHLRGLQPGFQSQHHSTILQHQQIPRQMNPQMQMSQSPSLSQSLAFQQQQQWDRMRRRQPATPRAGMNFEKERPMVEVKIENTSESLIDGNTFTTATVNTRQTQMQFRQQQVAAAMASLHAQSGQPFKQLASLQIPQIQSQNMVPVRAPPVKVEGFQELMGGDLTKHDSEEHKLTSPSK